MSTVSETTYQNIRTRILDGNYEPGFRLREEEVAENLGVSRTPVREALRRLAAEGLLDFNPNRGTEVIRYDVEELDEIFALRAALEGYGARMAATVDPGPNLDLLRDLVDQMEATGAQSSTGSLSSTWQTVSQLNNEFHSTVLASAGSARLTSVLSPLVHLPLVLRTFRRYTPEGLARSFGHHRELVAAIEARDPDWAEAVMRAHIFQGRAVLTGAYREGTDSAGIGGGT